MKIFTHAYSDRKGKEKRGGERGGGGEKDQFVFSDRSVMALTTLNQDVIEGKS